MRRNLIALLAIALLPATSGCDKTEDKRAPLVAGTAGVDVANTILATWPDLDATTCGSKCFSLDYSKVPAAPNPKFWEYTNGVPLYGIWLMYQKTHDRRYRDYVKDFVDRWVDADGNISFARPYPIGASPNDPRIQDTMQPATLLFGLYEQFRDERYLKAMTNARNVFSTISVLPESTDPAKKYPPGAFWHKPNYQNQQWLDAVYMSEPFLARYGARYAEQVVAGDSARCFDVATSQIKYLAENTYDEPTGLYYHAWMNDGAGNKWFISGGGLNPANGKVPPVTGAKVSPVLWSRSIAWYLAGVVDTLEYLPAAHADRTALLEVVRNIAAGLKAFQDPATGLWYQAIAVKNDALPAEGGYPGEGVAAQPNWLETSASAIFTYSLAKSVRLGYLPHEYLDVARKAWAGVKAKMDTDAEGMVTLHGTVVGMSVGGTYNAYVNADFRSDLDTGAPPAASTCAALLGAGHSPPLDCKYLYVRDNVPQGLAAVMLASSELEF